MKILKKILLSIVEYPFIFTGILLILDISWHDFFLHKNTFQVDAEAVLECHMEICRDSFIIVILGLALRFRKFIAAKMLIRPLLPVYVIVIIDFLSKYYIIYYYKLSFHPLTILAILIGIFQTIILINCIYIISLFSPRVIRYWLFHILFITLLIVTIFDAFYFKYTETHIQSILFSNLNFNSANAAISGINSIYFIISILMIVLLSRLNLWSLKGIVSVDKFRTSLICLFPILGMTLILIFILNIKCLAIDRDLGENFGTIYIRLEKARQKYRNLLSVSPFVNLINERYVDLKDGEKSCATKPFIAYTNKESHLLKSLGFIKSTSSQTANNYNPPYRTIVLIIFESLHSDFIHFTNPAIAAEATPYFDQLIRDYPHLENYFTSSIPTTPGLNSTFLSQIFFTPEFSIKHHPCTLFSLLAEKGLDGFFISGVSGDHQDERRIYPKLFRISHYIAKEELDRRYHGASGWGYHDDIIFQEGLRVLKERKDSSTFLVLKLIDLHQPGEYSGIRPEESPTVIRNMHDTVIDSLYWENKCLEKFFNQAKRDGIFNDDTLFVITADHGPFIGSQRLARLENRRVLSKIPLIFISSNTAPVKDLKQKRFASQIDLAPTLLSIMRIESPSYFLGNNLLSDSSEFALGLWDNLLYYDRKGMSFTTPVNMPSSDYSVRTSAVRKFLNNIYSDSFLKDSTQTGI